MVQTMNGSIEAVGPALGVNAPYYHHHYHITPTNGYYHGSTTNSMESNAHITVVQIDQNQSTSQQHHLQQTPVEHQVANNSQEADFVTVLTIASSPDGAPKVTPTSSNFYSSSGSHSSLNLSSQKVFVDNRRGEIEEEVTIYRLPGERLGMALRFDGGQGVCQTIRRVFVQNISANSPASKAIGLMLGILREGDEILQIDGRLSSSLTRLECITLLRDAPVCIRLFVRRSLASSSCTSCIFGTPYATVSNCADTNSTCCQMAASHSGIRQHELLAFHSDDHASHPVKLTPTEQTLSHTMHSWEVPKKVPPPVPPRMATTTLSTKRKPRPTPVPPLEELSSSSQCSTETGVSYGNVSSSSSESIAPVEKPPRRKNLLQNGNPPPLPPRRPKGPPPKPPTEHIPVLMQNATNSNTSTSINSSNAPSLVTVISTSPNTTAEVSTPAKVSSISITSPSTISLPVAHIDGSKTSHIKTSATSKVTFTISNSKVSSFIRHTAEKLHRKLSGKTAMEEEESKHKSAQQQNLTANIEASSIKVNVASEHPNRVTLVTKPVTAIIPSQPVIETNPEPTLTGRDSSTPSFAVPPAAIYMDSCQDMDIGSAIESDTDDTSSSVSTIIERSSVLSESFMPCFENSPYFSHKSRNLFVETEFDSPLPSLSSHTISIVNRVLSPFERLERELDREAQNGPFSLSSFATNFPPNEHSFRSLSLLPSLTANETKQADEQVQLSSNKTFTLIADDQLAASNMNSNEQLNCQSMSPSSIPVDTDSRRDYENVQKLQKDKKKPIETVESFTENSALLKPPREFANTNTRQGQNTSVLNEKSTPASDNNNVCNDMLESGTRHQNHQLNLDDDDDDDDEDFDLMKNDIISRVDDDKEDFMLDTNYLNESSSRYLFHHSGSELILAPYSELSSITEEDEEDELGSNSDKQIQSENSNVGDVHLAVSTNMHSSLSNIEQTASDTIVECVKEDSQSIELDSLPPIIESSEHFYDQSNVDNNNKMKHFYETDNEEERSNSSNSSSQKVSLDNVFDFLNETADEFEFVEKMLQLTNDKIDSIDDIMRIRESLRGLQQSEQRGNLQRFLDGKDVIDELMALSSPPHSTASSPENECQMSDVTEDDLPLKLEHHQTQTTTTATGAATMSRELPKPLSIDMAATNLNAGDEFTSLPVFLAIDNHRTTRTLPPLSMTTDKCDLRHLSNSNLSKIPTLAPNPAPPISNTLGKRSQSVSNIFNRSGGFNSLIELRPSLIPRPISNFNLSLPSDQEIDKLAHSHFSSRQHVNGHLYNHNCLNRATSMQSISSNSLPRHFAKNKTSIPGRRISGLSSQWNPVGGTNYHHNCLRNSDSNPPAYGSLSRGVSRSTANVFNTGSLPRASKAAGTSKVASAHSTVSNQVANGHYGNNLRTSSLIDLTYGFASNKPSRLVQPNPVLPNASRRHSSSNLFVRDSVSTNEDSGYQADIQSEAITKSSKSAIRSSSSLISLPSANATSSHFWHCSNHSSLTSTPQSAGKAKRSTSGVCSRTRSNVGQSNVKTGKLLARKCTKSMSCTSSSSSTKSESDDQQVPPTRSILRHSSSSKYSKHPKEFNYWNQRNQGSYELTSHSDSESSDITISSGESGDCERSSGQDKSWQSKRRNSHKVCFVDEIVQHQITPSSDFEYRSASIMEAQPGEDKKQQQMPPKLLTTTPVHPCEERFDSSSSPELPHLSSSTSSICSMSSTELTKAKEHPVKNNDIAKSFFLPVSAHREDSGIFASDDTSTSEFSQSPSPDLLIGAKNATKIKQSDQIEPQSMKDRIAFFDPVIGSKTTADLNRSLSCNKSSILVNGQMLSRSCSAPYETNCELGVRLIQHGNNENILLTPPQSPPNERIKKERNSQSLLPCAQFPKRRTETTAYPVTIEFKKSTPFSLRDSMITARRHQNTCKLKGLVIPESSSSNGEQVDNGAIPPAQCFPPPNRIDLPTIISEETFKVTNSKDFVNENGEVSADENEVLVSVNSVRPIEIIDLKTTTPSVPKYSPMFKRRPFTLPANPEINYNNNNNNLPKTATLNESESKLTNNKPGKPPAVPPKPKLDLPSPDKIINSLTMEVQRPPPPLPPKRKDIKLEILDTNGVIFSNTPQMPIETPVVAGIIANSSSKVEAEITDLKCAEDEELIPVISESPGEFVIHQKQYSMRAIVFELAEAECTPLGIVLTGGLDSESREVTVMHIEPDSLASRDGRLQIGDRIVSINGKLLLSLTHEETVELLQSSLSTHRVMIVFSRAHDHNFCPELPSPTASICSPSILASMNFANTPLVISSIPAVLPNVTEANGNANANNYKTVKAEIAKDVNGIGFIIEGGKASSLGDRPIVIKRIFRGGPVDKEGSLMEGDELLSVNEQSVQDMTRAETWNFLKQLADGKVTLIARRKRYF